MALLGGCNLSAKYEYVMLEVQWHCHNWYKRFKSL